jgi:hypothetical protein
MVLLLSAYYFTGLSSVVWDGKGESYTTWTKVCRHLLVELTFCTASAVIVKWKCLGATTAQQVSAAMFHHLVESLPRRVEAVIAAKGGTTPY